MRRLPGLTVITILSLVGSAFTLALGVGILAMTIFVSSPATQQFPGPPMLFRIVLIGASLLYVLPAGWGIVTGIGLWRMRNWARISAIVFSVLLLTIGGFAALVSLITPIPVSPRAGIDPAIVSGVRAGIGVFWLLVLGMSVWWLVYLTRPKVRGQFQLSSTQQQSSSQINQPAEGLSTATAAPPSGRPLSITIIAWLLLAGSLLIPLGLFLHPVAILFTKMLTGWSAMMLLLVLAALQLFLGVGLLKLRERARIAAIAYYAFTFANTCVFYLAPGARSRLMAFLDAQESMFPWVRLFEAQTRIQFDPIPSLVLGSISGLLVLALPVYFLITRKSAFEPAANLLAK